MRLHTGARARRSADALNARAYTAGAHIVFGDRVAAANPLRRPHLLAHELAHVVQQGARSGDARPAADPVRTASSDSTRSPPRAASRSTRVSRIQRAFADTLPYGQIAARINRAIVGLGTDEEAVYRALQQLRRDPDAIRRLERIYLERYRETLIEAIEGDFSGEELEFALQLLRHGERDTRAQERIERVPAATGDWDRAARRLYDAMPGTLGTEEEVVFAVLLPLDREPARIERLSRAYRRLDPMGLRARLHDEFSGEELDYAMALLAPNASYEHFLRRGHEELAGRPEFGHPAGEFCNIDAPDSEELYDRRYWEEHGDPARRSCKLRLKTGIRPSFAVESMFEEADEWKLDCAQFVQILHLYALLHTLGPFEFDRRFGGGTFELRMAESSWIDTETLWFREGPSALMRPGTRTGEDFEPSATLKPRAVDRVLADAPVGSRVMWHNALL
ncbi:MAG: eCIS core domain-containing protein, partial [Gemmatimonadota bacterium]